MNDRPAEVTNLPTQLLWGEEAIEEEILGLRFRVRPNAFLQTNTAMCERLYRLAVEYAGLTGEETVYDLYCGIGTIGLSLATRRADGVGNRGLGGVGRLRGRERRAERDRRTPRSSRATSARTSRSCASAPASPTSSSSTRRAPGSQARPSAASRGSRRRGSSTSPATRRRSRATRRSSSRSTATGSSASGRSTCSRTRRTSRRSRSSRAAPEPGRAEGCQRQPTDV